MPFWFRSISNIIKNSQLIKWIINNNISDKDIISNLYSQFCYLESNIEYNILANHFIANAKALIFGGLFFKNQKSELIFLKGINLLNKELKTDTSRWSF